METPFVINTKASHFDLAFELNNRLSELEGSLNVMSIAAHDEGSPEEPFLAVIRQTQDIRQIADVVTNEKTESNGTKKNTSG